MLPPPPPAKPAPDFFFDILGGLAQNLQYMLCISSQLHLANSPHPARPTPGSTADKQGHKRARPSGAVRTAGWCETSHNLAKLDAKPRKTPHANVHVVEGDIHVCHFRTYWTIWIRTPDPCASAGESMTQQTRQHNSVRKACLSPSRRVVYRYGDGWGQSGCACHVSFLCK